MAVAVKLSRWLRGLVIIVAAMPLMGEAHGDCEATPLSESMKEMKTTFKSMNAAVKERDWAGIAASRNKMEELTAVALAEKPLKLEDVPAAKQAQFLQEYQQGLDKLEAKLGILAEYEKTKDIVAATSLVDEIADYSKASHKSFKKKCD